MIIAHLYQYKSYFLTMNQDWLIYQNYIKGALNNYV